MRRREGVSCVPLGGLTVTCVSSELQLACRTVCPLMEGTAVPTALNSCRISTHTLPPPIPASQLALKVAQDIRLDIRSHLLHPLPKDPDRVSYPLR